ncbi:hypothetical protein TWF225_003194 [Orbilia oligospora]|nr:hypothetical protein TWF225_003194 [Orbilia oligospora]KAF3267415.1 hypothetical protein TWF217_000478 [Orbilia oligospora]
MEYLTYRHLKLYVVAELSIFASLGSAYVPAISVYFPDFPNRRPWRLCQPTANNLQDFDDIGTDLFVINPEEESCNSGRRGRYGSGFWFYPLYLDLQDATNIPAIYLDGYDTGAQIRYPTIDRELPFIVSRDRDGYRPAYWIVKRSGRRIDPAIKFFQEGDTLEFVGSSMEEDHTLRLYDYGPGIGYRINRGFPALDNPRIELRYANNCFLGCCTKFLHCLRDIFGTEWREENVMGARQRRRAIAPEGEDQENAGLRQAANLLALADQLEQLAAQIEAAEVPPVDNITRVSIRETDESEHDLQFWDNLLGDSPERPVHQEAAMEESNSVINLIPFPDIEEDRFNAGNGESQNSRGIELIPIQGQLQREEDEEDIEAQPGSSNDERLNNAFRGPLDRSY